MNTQNMTPNEIRRAGIEVLTQGLGAVGMVNFLQQSKIGWGNYTADRAQWLDKTTLADIQTALPQLKKSRALLETAR
ncbi:MAG: hypothetical protein WAO71_06660 [Gallionella sp.]